MNDSHPPRNNTFAATQRNAPDVWKPLQSRIMKKTGMYKREIWCRACNLPGIRGHRATVPTVNKRAPSKCQCIVSQSLDSAL